MSNLTQGLTGLEKFAMTRRGYIILIVLVAVLGAAASVVLTYTSHFSGKFSDIHATWGTFGDYVGGLLNPFIAFLNLIVTVVIAFEIHHLSKTEGDREQQSQRALLKTQLQFDLLKDHGSKFDHGMDVTFDMITQINPNSEERIKLQKLRIAQTRLDFQRAAMHLFGSFEHESFIQQWNQGIEQVHQWVDIVEAVPSIQHGMAIRTEQSVMMAVLYHEMLGRPVDEAVLLLGIQQQN